MAFTYDAKKRILKRDQFTCQTCGKSRSQGWNLQAAHWPELHQKAEDNNPANGRALCTECHVIEELERGNAIGAQFLYDSQTFLTHGEILSCDGIVMKDPTEAELRELFLDYGDEVTVLTHRSHVTFAIVGDERPDWNQLVRDHFRPKP